jgi:molybdate transport system substrate-binding protein
MKVSAVVIAVLAAVTAGGCGGAGRTGGSAAPQQVVVLAAASLTDAFPALGKAFTASHPGIRVTFQFAASSVLAQQVADGAPGDVLATADEETMARVVAAGHAHDPLVVDRNQPALLVERGNPKHVDGLAALSRPDVVFVACAPEVPCGRVATALLQRAGVTRPPASREENVKAVVAKVTLGEADAGIVYATDVRAAGRGTEAAPLGVDTSGDPAFEPRYPMAVTAVARRKADAAAFVTFTQSAAGQAVLARFGFLPA